MNVRLLLPVIIIGSIAVSGCLEKVAVKKTRIIKTAEIVLNKTDSDLQSKKEIRITVKPVFGKTINQFPQLVKDVFYEYTQREEKYSHYYSKNVIEAVKYGGILKNFPLFPLPIFEVAITNNSDHVLKFSNVVLAIEDSVGNIFDALGKYEAKSYLKRALELELGRHGVPKNKINNAVDISDLYSDQILVSLIDNNFKVLPGRTKKGFLAFNYGKFSNKEFREFVYRQERLNVQLFEIPIKVDKAGKTSETTHFSFNFDVKIHRKSQDYIVYEYKKRK